MAGHTPDAEQFLEEAVQCPDCGVLHNESYCPRCEEMEDV